jgi:predicted molibdopterin-dependent oxidoreductase YjgC
VSGASRKLAGELIAERFISVGAGFSNERSGELFATFHSHCVSLNFVDGPHRDRFVKSPEYKATAVRVEKL